MTATALTPQQLYHACDEHQLPFETTDEITAAEDPVGQPRAVAALDFGFGIDKKGYNIFAAGDKGTGKHKLIREQLDKRASSEAVPPDICYVNNFADERRPRVLTLAPGKGKTFAKEMKEMITNVRLALRTAFENEDYQNRSQAIQEELKEKQKETFQELNDEAKKEGLTILRTPSGLSFAPVKENDEVMPPEEYQKLPEEERNQYDEKVKELQNKAGKILQQLPKWQREVSEKQKELDREVSQYAIDPIISELIETYKEKKAVKAHLKSVEKDIVENRQAFLENQEGGQDQMGQMFQQQKGQGGDDVPPALRKYHVNVTVDNGETKGAPVVYEENPTYQNLLGRIEHQAQMGTLVTDFNMIQPGALHRANGGYLILDALKVLQEPFAWEGLKRTLRSGEVKIESIGQMYSLISTVSLEPEPLALDVKVVLIGWSLIYYIVKQNDPEFSELFKVTADFSRDMNWDDGNQKALVESIARTVKDQGIRPFDRSAVARVIEQRARRAGDARKLSIHMQSLKDLLLEAEYWSGRNGNDTVRRSDVQKAIDEWIYRSDSLRERMQEQIDRDIVFLETDGSRVGQINGLAVILLGEFMFGRPNRITARVSLGKGEIVDIEREVEMGGPLHSKGVLVLAGYLKARYAWEYPLSLSASLVFEQSYSGVDGDSASSAELYALISAIGDIPLKQSLAVTGSVNQHGQVQPIGGVNEKIEGFFDTCKSKGLTGEQGVLIPESNVQHLMLRRDVIDAVEQGQFHIYPVTTIDQGLELLTGMTAGEPDSKGYYPEKSLNGVIYNQLSKMAKRRMELAHSADSGKEA